jgi:hypothetical protein
LTPSETSIEGVSAVQSSDESNKEILAGLLRPHIAAVVLVATESPRRREGTWTILGAASRLQVAGKPKQE